MARAARLSGEIDEEEQEIENLLQERRDHPSELVICSDLNIILLSLFNAFFFELKDVN